MPNAPQTVFDAFRHVAVAHPDKPFLCLPARADRPWQPEGGEWSYGAVAARVAELRTLYRDAGYGHGHRVALLLENRPDFFLHYLALNALGVGIVPVNPDYRHDEMLYQMEHSEAALAVAVPERVADLERVAAERAKPLPVVDAYVLPGSLPPAAEPPPRAGAPGTDSECGLLYTSGTTGRPKGCVLTNFYYLTAGAWYRDLGGLLTIRRGGERFYNPLPLFHMNHQAVTATCAILTANCLILPERFSPARWWSEVVGCGATIVHYLGVVPPLLLNQEPSPLEKQHKVRFGLGAGVEPELHPRFEERFGFPLVEVWGMTETGRIFADNVEPRQITTRAFGRPVGEFEAKVVDEQDHELPRGSDGELVVRCAGPDPRRGFFAGYLKNPQATAEAWRGGWFHTGDVVRQSDDGMLYFVDRKKNIIRRAGENIAAAEVEACLQAHDEVAQVAVLGAPDELREEEVMACIVPMPGTAPDAALAGRLFDWCMARLAYYKAPGWLLFVERLPTTGTQKVQKTQIFAADEDPRRRAGIIDLRERKKRR
jgi:crotonobetaine/carnitine-CoA ligase